MTCDAPPPASADRMKAVSFIVPLLLIGAAAGALRAASHRAAEPGSRKLLTFAWIATLLFGAPLWLFLAATLGL